MGNQRRRMILGSGSSSRLPAAYQEVEYLQSTGTQYIDTGVVGSDSIGYEFDYVPLNVTAEKALFGEGSYAVGARGCFHMSSKWYPYWGTSSNYSGAVANTRYLLKYNYLNNRVFSIDGTTKTTFSSSSGVTGSQTAFLFAANHVSWASAGYYKSSIKLYGCKMTDGSSPIRNFIPCYRKADGVAGMYDTVGNQFYTNAGTGVFVVGRPVGYTLPSDYTKATYIQSTNGKQWIDTQIKPTSAYRLQGRVKRASGTAMFASVQSSVSGGTNVIRIDSSSTYQYYSNASASYKAQMGSVDTNWHEFYTNNRTINWDGTAYSVSGGAACTSQDYNLWLFWDNKGGSPNPGSITGASQIDYFTICDTSGELVLFFESCVRNSDNVAGMYDHISGSFFTNAGTGSFIVGG